MIEDQPRGSESADPRPALSVVIPCRNAADTLGTQLDALVQQKCPVPWEVVLCDNGSTDASRSLATTYRTRIPQLTIVDAAGVQGAGAVRNLGVQQAQGRWIAFCDADDEVATGWLEAMAHALSGHRLVAGAFEGRRLNDPRTLRSRDIPQSSGLQSADYGARLPHAGAGNLGIHRDLFLALGGFDPHLRWLEDTDLCWRAQMSGDALTFVPEAVVHVRLRPTLSRSIRQGWEYGRAHVTLQERYERLGHGLDAVAATSDAAPASGRLRVADLVRDPRRSAWRLGHSLGRRAQGWDRTSPIDLGPPRLAGDGSYALDRERAASTEVSAQHA